MPKLFIDIASPRSSIANRSDTTPGPTQRAPDAPSPDKKRKAISDPMLGASAHARTQETNKQFDAVRTIRRPKISDRGPRNRGPTANPSHQNVRSSAKSLAADIPITNIVIDKVDKMVFLFPKSRSMYLIPGANTLLAKEATNWRKETRANRPHFSRREKFNGIAGSS